MKLLWSDEGWEDYLHWQENDRGILARVNALIVDIRRGRHTGTGKPEPLHGNLKGWWSRRITGEHRLVYRIVGAGDDQRIEIMMCRFHYTRRRQPAVSIRGGSVDECMREAGEEHPNGSATCKARTNRGFPQPVAD